MAAFDRAIFNSDGQFLHASFLSYAGFSRLSASGAMYFAKAEFGGRVSFASPWREAKGGISLASARAKPEAFGSIWPDGWELKAGIDGWGDLVQQSAPGGANQRVAWVRASLEGAQLKWIGALAGSRLINPNQII